MADGDYYGSGDRERASGGYGAEDDPYLRPYQRPRGWGCLAWVGILALVGFLVYVRDHKAEEGVALPPLDDTAASTQGLMELQVRALIGLGEFFRQNKPGENAEIVQLFRGDPANPADQAQHTAQWTHGTFGQRMQYAIAGGELAGPATALELLGKLKWDWEATKLQPSAEQLAVFNSLKKTYRDFAKGKMDAPSVPDADRTRMIERLGWYGKLALTPPKAPDQFARNTVLAPALRIVYTLFGIAAFVIVLGVIGTLGLIAFSIAALLGRMQIGLREGSGSGGIYAETFAIWLFLFTGGLLSIEFCPWEQLRLPLQLVVMFGSLLVLLWPMMRGLSWTEVREDLGLTWGRSGVAEPFLGVPAYAMMLPMLAVGFALTLLLLILSMGNQAGQGDPAAPFEARHMVSHPIVNVVLRGDFWMRFQLLLLACVAAPIVEEIMFRGVLYRNLRDATGRFGWLLSCLASALWVSFIFAVIHPQGMIAVPALMSIACGCTLAREWRDSLWASMVVHSINNSLIFSMLMFGAMT